MDSKKPEECDLETVCAASLSETGHVQDDDESEDDDEDEFDLDDDERDDPEEKPAADAELERKQKPKRKGFLHNSFGSSFVQTGSELEKGVCYEQERNYEDK